MAQHCPRTGESGGASDAQRIGRLDRTAARRGIGWGAEIDDAAPQSLEIANPHGVALR